MLGTDHAETHQAVYLSECPDFARKRGAFSCSGKSHLRVRAQPVAERGDRNSCVHCSHADGHRELALSGNHEQIAVSHPPILARAESKGNGRSYSSEETQ